MTYHLVVRGVRAHPTGRDQAAGPGARSPLPLTDGWLVWPLAVLRSAGLPAERVLELAGDGPGDGFAAPERVTRAVERFALDGWCREAVTWQSPAIVENWLDDYARRLRDGDGALPRRARKEATAALYLQRYATKNDTIGFFGPVSWARVRPDLEAGLRAGAPGAQRRATYLEPWAMEALARAWEADPALRPHLPARRDPSARLSGTRMTFPRRPPADLSAEEAAVAALCDRPLSAAKLLPRLRAERPELGFERVAEVVSVLARLQRLGCVLWGFHLPLDQVTDAHLLEQLLQVPDEAARAGPVTALGRLREGVAAVAAAAGDPDAVLAALRGLEREYEAAAGAATRRTKGESQTGRALVWQDVLERRDVAVGEAALQPLRPALGLVLDTCRWLTWEIARGVAAAAAGIVRASGEEALPLARVVLELTPELRGEPGSALDRAVREMQARAAGILLAGATGQQVRLSVEQVAGPWREAFAAPGPGWAAGATHSPDLMLAAASPEAVARDEFQWVLGEVHVAVNTLENRCFVAQEERPGEIAELMALTAPQRRYVPAFPRSWPDMSARAYPPLAIDLPDRYVHWAIEPVDTLPADAARLPAADLEVRAPAGREPVVVSRADPAFHEPLVEVIGELLSFLAGNAFKLLPPLPHLPRVTVGRLVLRRESWALPPAPLLACRDEAALAALLRQRGVPRHTFARVPGEAKPILCDTRAEPLLRAIARALGRSEGDGEVRFEEMLPGFGDLWLRDGAGLAHTSELRLVAVDRRRRDG